MRPATRTTTVTYTADEAVAELRRRGRRWRVQPIDRLRCGLIWDADGQTASVTLRRSGALEVRYRDARYLLHGSDWRSLADLLDGIDPQRLPITILG